MGSVGSLDMKKKKNFLSFKNINYQKSFSIE